MTNRERAEELTGGCSMEMVTTDDIEEALSAAEARGRKAGLEAAWKAAASPDDGYLHGCDCRARIRALAASEAEEGGDRDV